ncbi:hypothetical protein RFI_14796 [Reticulomyxa filosa]|uniref:rRNA adenine N(6)-methyltransferase n=1 Tax=Reticulomyxa filosa TaxID=46433 RepID=X6N944_RETFI|nr:hypothetical protein RFI_14796 [Reticulomyxa filosa]|eukprot:ETO22403.1 hypothetical protein RFI_14796 [Reticulomyxa filosa]
MSILSSAAPPSGYGKHTKAPTSTGKKEERHHAFYFTSTKGQHILKNPGIIHDMIDKSGIKETDIVLEIGPGTGNLTMQLLEKCKQVIAIEVDVRMVSELRKRVMGTKVKKKKHNFIIIFLKRPFESKLQIIHGDAIKTNFPFFNLCIANIPYQISSPLIFKLLAHRPHFRCAVLMLQDEFAKRMVARPGDYVWSRLSINCQLLARVGYLKKVGKANFRPPPKVESALIRLEPRHPPPPINFLEWDGLIRICFERRHRLLQKIFNNKSVLENIEKNHRLFCEMKKWYVFVVVLLLFVCVCTVVFVQYTTQYFFFKKKKHLEPVADVKATIRKVLEECDLADKRPRHLDIPDFLKLMKMLNDKGFHFK